MRIKIITNHRRANKILYQVTVKGKVVSANTMKAYRAKRGIVALILYLGARQR